MTSTKPFSFFSTDSNSSTVSTGSPPSLPPIPLSEVAWLVSYVGYSLEIEPCLSTAKEFWYDDTLLIGAPSASIATLRYGTQERTRFMYACLSGNLLRCQRLVKAGAELNHSIQNNLPLPRSGSSSSSSLTMPYDEYDESSSNCTRYGRRSENYTPLYYAVQSGNVALIEYLLSINTTRLASVTNSGSSSTNTVPVSSSTQKKLINVAHTTTNGYTILHHALFQGNSIILRKLLEYTSIHHPHLVHTEIPHEYGLTLLHFACIQKSVQPEIVSLLLDYKIDPLLVYVDENNVFLSREDSTRHISVFSSLCEPENLPTITKKLSVLLKHKQISDYPSTIHSTEYMEYTQSLSDRSQSIELVVNNVVKSVMDKWTNDISDRITPPLPNKSTSNTAEPLPPTLSKSSLQKTKRILRKEAQSVVGILQSAYYVIARWSVHTEPYKQTVQTILTKAIETLEQITQ